MSLKSLINRSISNVHVPAKRMTFVKAKVPSTPVPITIVPKVQSLASDRYLLHRCHLTLPKKTRSKQPVFCPRQNRRPHGENSRQDASPSTPVSITMVPKVQSLASDQSLFHRSHLTPPKETRSKQPVCILPSLTPHVDNSRQDASPPAHPSSSR